MSEVQTVNVDDLSEGGGRVPIGRYRARLMSSEGKQSKQDKPMVEVAWQITQGEQEGSEVRQWFSLSVSEKNGKKYAGGIIDMKRTFAAVNKPLPAAFKFPLDAATANKLFAGRLKGVEIELAIIADTQRQAKAGPDDKNVYTRTQVIGLAEKPQIASADVADGFDFGDD